MNGTSGQGYEYEIFISYPRRIPVRGFVIGGFGPVLEEQLALRLPQPPKVFIDQKNLETGVRWPDALADIHAKSKVLIPVLIPAYFNSDWCVAEYESMLCREAHICREARVKGQNPNLCRLIFPVLLATASQFPFPLMCENVYGLTLPHSTRYPRELFEEMRGSLKRWVHWLNR
jgi:TIR domain